MIWVVPEFNVEASVRLIVILQKRAPPGSSSYRRRQIAMTGVSLGFCLAVGLLVGKRERD